MDGSANLQSLQQFFDHLSDGVLLFDRRALVIFANTAALRRLPGVVDRSLAQWEPALGAPLVEWLRQAIAGSPGAMRMPGQAAARSAVAIRMPRSVDSVVAMAATAVVGAAFVYIDPKLPVQRQEALWADSGAVVGVTSTVVPG